MAIDVITTIVAVFFAASSDQTISKSELLDFDLKKVKRKKPTCADRGSSDDVVVCASKNMSVWISAANQLKFAAKPIRGKFVGPLNAETTIHVAKSANPMAAAPAAVATLKWQF